MINRHMCGVSHCLENLLINSIIPCHFLQVIYCWRRYVGLSFPVCIQTICINVQNFIRDHELIKLQDSLSVSLICSFFGDKSINIEEFLCLILDNMLEGYQIWVSRIVAVAVKIEQTLRIPNRISSICVKERYVCIILFEIFEKTSNLLECALINRLLFQRLYGVAFSFVDEMVKVKAYI